MQLIFQDILNCFLEIFGSVSGPDKSSSNFHGKTELIWRDFLETVALFPSQKIHTAQSPPLHSAMTCHWLNFSLCFERPAFHPTISDWISPKTSWKRHVKEKSNPSDHNKYIECLWCQQSCRIYVPSTQKLISPSYQKLGIILD